MFVLPKIICLILHHLSRKRETLKTLELLHLLLTLDVAAFAEQDILLGYFSWPT